MRQHPEGWPNALHPRLSPCRGAADRHPCSRSHASLVEGFRAWRESALADAEEATQGYAAELAAWWESHERPTFRTWLVHSRQEQPVDQAA